MRTQFISHAALKAQLTLKPAGYLEALEPCIVKRDETGIWLDRDSAAYQRLAAESPKQTPPAAAVPVAVDPSEWPLMIRAIADQANAADAGVGDTFKRMVPQEAERFVLALKAAGIDCGCNDRQANLNARFPYRKEGKDAATLQSG